MRIQGSDAAATVPRGTVARRAAAGSFALPQLEAGQTAASAAGLRTISGIDVLIALQGLEEVGERRKRAVRRGRIALDVLDELKIGILAGNLSPAILDRLRSSAAVLKDRSGEANLDSVLNEIELRVEVEIAKMTGPRG